MEKLDNPAGRLHALLWAFNSASAKNKSIAAAWAEVLGVDESAVPREMTVVVDLIPQLERAVEATADSGIFQTFEHHVERWVSAVLATRRDWRAPSPGSESVIDADSLVALGLLSAHLSAVAPEGPMPTAEVRADLVERLEGIRRDLAEDPHLATELRSALSDHISQVIWAITHARIVGPNGVQGALERLSLRIGAAEQDLQDSPPGWFERARQTTALAWKAFAAGPVIRRALASWAELLGLPPGDL